MICGVFMLRRFEGRLVKEMRLHGIASIEAANAFLPTFIATWNKKFAVPARDATSAHRPWTSTPEALDDILARREEWVLSKALSFRSSGTLEFIPVCKLSVV